MSDIEALANEIPDLADARALRARKLKLSIATSLLIKPLAIIIPFITVPLLLKYLGNTRYGLYESVGALAAWLGLSNVGLGLGLINKLTETHISGDRELARRYVTTIFVATGGIAIVGMLVLSAVTPLINWADVFPTDDKVALRETPWAVWVVGLAVFLGAITSIANAIYIGYQEIHRSNIWDGISKVSVLIGLVVLVVTPFGLVGAIAASALLPILVRLGNTVDLFAREKPWLRPQLACFDRALLRELIVQGLAFFLLHVAFVGVFQVDKLVIANVLGPAEVSGFAVIGRLFLIVLGVVMLVLQPLWPAYGEAFRRGDISWIRRLVHITTSLSCLAYFACGAVMFFFGDWVLGLWTRGQAPQVSKMLILGMTATFVFRGWTECQAIALNGSGVLRPQIFFLGANAALNVVFAIVFAKLWGVEGVAWSIPVSSLLTSTWGYPWIMRRYVYSRASKFDSGAAGTVPSAIAD